jgi:hypothetical protein
MKEDQLKQILLFFFFVTLSAQRSKELAREAWFWCLDKKKNNPDLNSDEILLLSLERSWKYLEKETRSGVSLFSTDSGWLFPHDLPIEAWKEFQKTASNEELFITVVAKILKIPETLLTKVLGLSAGTIRYRLAKTARKIGISSGMDYRGRS